ncbi:MAG: hypothetical protein M3393_06645 [Actinomycetota bacterium]|nr:hypothetical protein [Actinomycetota bacterium]
MRKPGGHVGAAVSALVDGQLEPESAEVAWGHVLGCRGCRRLVEQEGRIKTELARLAENEPSARLLGTLYSLNRADSLLQSGESRDAWAAVEEIEGKSRGGRRAGLAVVGAGSVSAAVLGFASLSGVTLGIGSAPGSTPAAPAPRPSVSSTPTTAGIAPAVSVHGRLPRFSPNAGPQRSVGLLNHP